MNSEDNIHRSAILDQFTRQAVSFAAAAPMRDEDFIRKILQAAAAGPDDLVLDVACGPGAVTCAFARIVRHATGIDVTPAMLEEARRRQAEEGLRNVSWICGDAVSLPYPDRQFSIVHTRFSLHHILDPAAALKEMRRVCRRGGKVVVVDTAPRADKADALNAMERLRDPSHVRAWTIEQLSALFEEAHLDSPAIETYRLKGNLDDLLARSFPGPGDEDRIRRIFEHSLQEDALDLQVRRGDSGISYSFPVAILTATVPKE